MTGAVPLASFMLLSGLCDTPTPRRASVVMSSAETHTPWAARVRAPVKKPNDSRYPVGLRAGALAGRLDFVFGLGQVDEQRDAFAGRQIAGGGERRRVVGVEGVGGHGRHDQVVALEPGDERGGARQALGRRPGVGHRELDDRLAEHPAQAGRPGHRRDLLLEVVHVGVGRRARLDHLERRQPRAGADERRAHRLGLGREDVLLEPVHQREVVGQPAVEDHRGVGVGVDETGQHHLSRGVDHDAAAIRRGDLGRRADRHDPRAVDGHGAAGDHAAGRIHRHHRAAGDDQRHRPYLPRLERCDRQRGEHGHQDGGRAHRLDCRRSAPPSAAASRVI